MSHRVDFDHLTPYTKTPTSVINEPRVSIGLLSPCISSPLAIDCRVDTGADYIILPESLAYAVGIKLNRKWTTRVGNASGRPVIMNWHYCDLEILNITINNIPVLFGQNAPALFGLNALNKISLTAGFTDKDWLLEWHPKSKIALGNSQKLQKQSEIEDSVQVQLDLNYFAFKDGVYINKRIINKLSY
jgi:gag-polyprotein putative aspartyl protease